MTNTSLSKQQRAVALRVAAGLSNGEIAKELFVSEDTVKSHVRKGMALTKTGSRNGLALYTVTTLMTEEQRREWLAGEVGQEWTEKLRHIRDRERDVLELLVKEPDLTNAELGKRLFISEDTVKTHLRRLATRAGVTRRNSRVVLTVRYALVRPVLREPLPTI